MYQATITLASSVKILLHLAPLASRVKKSYTHIILTYMYMYTKEYIG